MQEISIQYILNSKFYEEVKEAIISKLSNDIFTILLYVMIYMVIILFIEIQPDKWSDIQIGKTVICNRTNAIFCKELLEEMFVCIWDLICGILGIPVILLVVIYLEYSLIAFEKLNENLAFFMFFGFLVFYISINCKKVHWGIEIFFLIICVYVKTIEIKVLIIEFISIFICAFLCFHVYKYIDINLNKFEIIIKILKYLSGFIILYLFLLFEIITYKEYDMWINIFIIVTLFESALNIIKRNLSPEIAITNLYRKDNKKVEIKKLVDCDENIMMYITIDNTREFIGREEILYVTQSYSIKNKNIHKKNTQMCCMFCCGECKRFNKYVINKNKWISFYDDDNETIYVVHYTKVKQIKESKNNI